MEKIEDFLDCDEKVLFEGTYNVNIANQTSPTIINLEVFIQSNPLGYNLLIDNFYNTINNLLPPINFLLETITISSYEKDLMVKNGQINLLSGVLLNILKITLKIEILFV